WRIAHAPFIRRIRLAHDDGHARILPGQRQVHGVTSDGDGVVQIGGRDDVSGRALEVVGDGPVIAVPEPILDQIGDQWCYPAQLGMSEDILQSRLGQKFTVSVLYAVGYDDCAEAIAVDAVLNLPEEGWFIECDLR